MRPVCRFAFLFLLMASPMQASGQTYDFPKTRSEFAAAFSKLKEQMPAANALALLGPPDDIRTRRDPGDMTLFGNKESWRYGTSGHLTTATLGQVFIDKNERVQYIFGDGSPPPEGMFDEQQLRTLLRALDQVPSYNSSSHNPRHVIRAVNLLQPLGKEKAIAAIREYLRIASMEDEGVRGVFLVLRTLFEVPAESGVMPEMSVGYAWPQPQNPKLLPRFPIAVEEDIPFFVCYGFNLQGLPEFPESHVHYFEKHGRIRNRPLVPSDHPFKALASFEKSSRWNFTQKDGGREQGRQLLQRQVLLMLDTVYRGDRVEGDDVLPGGDKNKDLRSNVIQTASELKVRWDTDAQKYTFLDGTSLPDPVRKLYQREFWKPDVDGLNIELLMERQGPHKVYLCLTETYHADQRPQKGTLKIFDGNTNGRVLEEFATQGGKRRKLTTTSSGGMRSQGGSLKLAEGDPIQIEFVVSSQKRVSPTLKP